ncbi:MAG: VanZ family protein [Patescibacteria group bacterium]|nr:VanZ family protein [Patescibacteria group bacterium]
MKHFIFLWMPVIAWMGCIFFLSSQQRVSVSDSSMINFMFFKSLHVIEYGILFILTRRAIKYGTNIQEARINVYSFIFTTLYGITDEFHQRFVPTREGTIRDVIIDILGACLAWGIIRYSSHILPKKLNNALHRLRIL